MVFLISVVERIRMVNMFFMIMYNIVLLKFFGVINFGVFIYIYFVNLIYIIYSKKCSKL